MRKMISGGIAVIAVVGAFALGARGDDQLTVVRAHADSVTDLADDRKLVGIAQDVFFGQVVEQRGQVHEDESLSETQFAVRVLETIKGSLDGTVIVNQQGGYEDGTLVLMDGDMLLEPGTTYLFATRPYAEKGWHTLVPGYGDIAVRSAHHRDDLRARFRAARQAEIEFTG